MNKDAIIDLVMRLLRALGLVPPGTPAPEIPETPPPEQPTDRIKYPDGYIKTLRPGSSTPYGIPWTQVSRWEPQFKAAVLRVAPDWTAGPLFMSLMSVIESNAQHYTTGKTTGTKAEVLVRGSDAYDDVPAVGMMQVKCKYHQWRRPNADCYSPEGNIEIATAIIVDGIKQYGSWEEAIKKIYFPADDIQR
ncbi:MAG: hypothetical protein E6Q97_05755 [Desulfurellales bacterium]|nr:MAG: hypothetical protein E6Q97_05755 [Desulfurellales bacterium]